MLAEYFPLLTATFHLYAFDEDGNQVWDSGDMHNLVTTTGKNLALDRAFGIFSSPAVAIPAAIGYLGIGTDGTAAAAAQTQLNPTIPGTVYLQAFDAGTTTRTGQVVSTQCTISPSNGNFVIAEIGLFNGPANVTATLYNRLVVNPTFTKTSAISLIAQVRVTQS